MLQNIKILIDSTDSFMKTFNCLAKFKAVLQYLAFEILLNRPSMTELWETTNWKQKYWKKYWNWWKFLWIKVIHHSSDLSTWVEGVQPPTVSQDTPAMRPPSPSASMDSPLTLESCKSGWKQSPEKIRLPPHILLSAPSTSIPRTLLKNHLTPILTGARREQVPSSPRGRRAWATGIAV